MLLRAKAKVDSLVRYVGSTLKHKIVEVTPGSIFLSDGNEIVINKQGTGFEGVLPATEEEKFPVQGHLNSESIYKPAERVFTLKEVRSICNDVYMMGFFKKGLPALEEYNKNLPNVKL